MTLTHSPSLKPIRKPNRRLFNEVVHQGHW